MLRQTAATRMHETADDSSVDTENVQESADDSSDDTENVQESADDSNGGSDDTAAFSPAEGEVGGPGNDNAPVTPGGRVHG